MIGVGWVLLLVFSCSTTSIRPSEQAEGERPLQEELSVQPGGTTHRERPRSERADSHSHEALAELRSRLLEVGGRETLNGTHGQKSLLQSSVRPRHRKPTAGDVKPVDLAIFFGSVYAFLAVVYLVCFRSVDVMKVNASRALRQVAFLYWRHARLAPIISSAVLYVLADFAVMPTSNLSWPLALAGSGAIYNAVWHRFFYEWLDSQLGEGEDWWTGFKKVVAIQFLHTVVYLPIGILGWLISMVFLYRAASDGETHCTASMLAGFPTHLEVSLDVAGAQLASAFEASVMFWPLSNLINFSIIQMWSPGFRTTWDGIMALLWNLYVAAAGDDPAAVGPILTDIQTLSKQQTDSSADCDKLSFKALAEDLWEFTCYMWSQIVFVSETTAQYTQEAYEYCKEQTEIFLHWLWENIKLYSWLTKCWIERKTWESWCVFCFLSRWLYIIWCKALAELCSLSWKLWCLPFQMFENVKWYMALGFIPTPFIADPCPCPKAEFDKSWEDVGVIWDGDLLYPP
mmetsp:Transcript_71162/g.123453  ORF Transcript_71162/g.123453 Transcript_71162/m.123453 type:complete len:514 (+) Transcript_71162:81-1622(+)